jgi:hypothetical protein
MNIHHSYFCEKRLGSDFFCGVKETIKEQNLEIVSKFDDFSLEKRESFATLILFVLLRMLLVLSGYYNKVFKMV